MLISRRYSLPSRQPGIQSTGARGTFSLKPTKQSSSAERQKQREASELISPLLIRLKRVITTLLHRDRLFPSDIEYKAHKAHDEQE